jgi:hypothetical protein
MKIGKQGEGGGRPQFDGKPYDVVLSKLEQAWALDCSDKEAACLADISAGSLSKFLKAHPDVMKRKELLKERPVLNARNILHKAIAAGDGNLALKYLERKLKAEFGEQKSFLIENVAHLEWAKKILDAPELTQDVTQLIGKIAK